MFEKCGIGTCLTCRCSFFLLDISLWIFYNIIWFPELLVKNKRKWYKNSKRKQKGYLRVMSQENRCRKQMLFQSIYSDCFQFDMIGTLNLLMHVRLQFWLSRDHCWPYLVDWIYPFHQLTRSDRKDMIVGLTLVKKTSVDKLLKEEFHVAKLWILCMKWYEI